MDLKDKTVFITGSSVGIGRATAFEFAKEGAKLVITYRSSKKEAEDVVAKCKELGASDILLIKLDVMDDESIKAGIGEIKKHFGKIDILVNNAGYLVWGYLSDLTFDEIEKCVRTNLEGLIKLTLTALPLVSDSIINIASIAGSTAKIHSTVYGATKWGVRGFTKSLALELSNVKAYTVNPIGTSTQMNDFTGDPPEKVADLIVRLSKGKIDLPTGSDLNVWEY